MEPQYQYSDGQAGQQGQSTHTGQTHQMGQPAPTRTPFEMIRSMQSTPTQAGYQFDDDRRRHTMPAANHYSAPSATHSGVSNGMSNGLSNGLSPNYAHSSAQLPPLHSRGSGSTGPIYGQVQHPRSQQTSPVAQSMPFPIASYSSQAPYSQPLYSQPSYSQPLYSSSAAHYPTAPAFQHNSYNLPGSSIGYQSNYTSPTSGIADFPSLNMTSHGPAVSNSVASQPYQLPASEYDQGRTHVVGAQGRRGILPSDEGRPSALGNQPGGKPSDPPQKDANGKFPCQHCTRTYLHAKHLKRHMLRHTGERPYSCWLCSDTFSRSDILKRHFQKCAIRRGNPTGASHLSNPAAYNKNPPNRKGSTPQAGAVTRPSTSSSDNSTGPSAGESSFDQHGDIGVEGGNAHMGTAGINGVATTLGGYGSTTLHSSPATSPSTSRPPMGFYGNGSFAPNGNAGF